MVDFKSEVVKLLGTVIENMTPEEISDLIEVPKYTNMGDFAFPCFKLAKEFRKAPNMIAADLAEKLGGNCEYFEKIEAVAAYVNFTNSKEIFAKTVIVKALEENENYGATNVGNNKKVIVEYSSPNIAKPFHMGHIRTTMIGNALYRIYKFLGYDAVAINHLGDYGTQFGKLIVAFKKWGDRDLVDSNPIPELVKLYVKFHETAEEDPSLEDEARMWFKKLEDNDAEAYELWKWMRDASLKEFSRVYDMLDVKFDSYAGESFYSDKMPTVLEELRLKNVMKKDEGAEIVDLEAYGMPPALITKKDGSSLYITRDIAAAMYRKAHYDFYKNIYVVGSQQHLHFAQWKKVVELMGYEWAEDCVHVEFGMVALEEGSMSTRKGRVVYLEEVLKKAIEQTAKIIEEKNPSLENKEDVAKAVGVGAVVFQELSNNRIKDYTFSWEKTLSFEGETGPYVQYTHTRACSLLRKGEVENFDNVDYSKITDEVSIEVIRLLNKFPEVVVDAASKYEPSIISRYIVNLAQMFNRFYHENPILVDDEALKVARLSIVKSVATTIKNGLYLIGLKAPEKM